MLVEMRLAVRPPRSLIEMQRLPLSLDLERGVRRGDERESGALLILANQTRAQPEFGSFIRSQMRC